MTKIGFLGPVGTFGEEALLSQDDLAEAEHIAYRTMPEVLAATERGELDFGFVALENAIEGTVNASLDALIFDRELFIEREVVLPVHLNLMTIPGANAGQIRTIVSFPHAFGQCSTYLEKNMPSVETIAANSTADAAREVREKDNVAVAAIANAYSARIYGLDVVAKDIEDHPDNATRFVLVGKTPSQSRTGNDKTTIVCFEEKDQPGNLFAMLKEFADRNINLTKLESRPTKSALGEYCFIIDFEGHIDDENVIACLDAIRVVPTTVKILGSYPAAG